MKKIDLIKKESILFVAVLMITVLFTRCGDDDDEDNKDYGNWIESSTFDGNSRSNAVSFTIGTKGYLVTGYDGDDFLSDTWEYNSEGDFWVKKANFPGKARSGAVGFTINNKGYLGTGYDGDNELKDFWEYDPATNTWTQKADFAGTARYGAIGFSIGENGYIGTGYDGSEQKDFWKYNATSNKWEQSVGFGGEKRKDASVFVINNIAYIGTGIHNGAYEKDFYSFDGINWERLKNLDGDKGSEDDVLLNSGVGFSLKGKGYIATGVADALTKETWEYTPSTKKWKKMPKFEGAARQDASMFVFENKAYVLMGRSGGSYFDDVWEFRSEELENEDD